MSEEKTPFPCLGAACPNHCCGAYEGITPNLQSLGPVKFSEIILLPEDAENLRNANFGHLILVKEDGIARIKTAPDGTCAALVDGKCDVYDCRPAICRAYPLYLDMYVGVCALKECPGVTSQMTLENHPDALKSLLDVYQYWIDCYRQKK